MPEKKDTLTEKYFDKVYDANKDPWNFETSDYENKKYAATIKALTKASYKNAFEIGCSIGVLSKMLAEKCTHLLAVDSVEAPLKNARKRLQGHKNVQIERMTVPHNFGKEKYDLIIISEVAYYLNDKDLKLLRNKTIEHLAKGGQLLMVHWTPQVHDYPQTGDGVNDYYMALNNSLLKHLYNERAETYRLDLFEKI